MAVFLHSTHRPVTLDDVCKTWSLCLCLQLLSATHQHLSWQPLSIWECAVPAQPVVPSLTVAGGAEGC